MNPENHKIKRAIISVSDKTGIIEFAQELSKLSIEIYSTGGTAKSLSENGIPVKNISELTGFPEILDGRVKTLHPAVHAGLLAQLNNEKHLNQLNEHHLDSIDLLIVNLYPFEETLKNPGSSHEDIIENIDIGGPAMLRSAAKNYLWTVPVVKPQNYTEILNYLKKDGTIPGEFRQKLAGEVFSHTAYYDSLISNYFANKNQIGIKSELTLGYKLQQTLRYGENPHQKAVLYGNFGNIFTQLHGKELSYNNFLDIDAASRLILEFEEPAIAIIKHTNPCGVATATSLTEAYKKAFATDTVSPYGGIITMNRTLDLEIAETIHGIFTELLIAPDFTDKALEILMKKKDRRLIKIDFNKLKQTLGWDFKSIAGGVLMQETDILTYEPDNFKVVTERQPTKEEMTALKFAWIVCKHVKSNAIVFAVSDRTLGVGAGQMSRVDSAIIATQKAAQMGLDLHGSVVASDAYFPFADGVIQAADAGATAVIQPGGSIRDEEVIQAANNRNMAMVFTGMRHFRH